MMIDSDEIKEFHCPRYNEIPNIDLYMEQVITYIEDSLKVLYCDENEKIITSAMINNYVKQKIVSPPKKKHYNKNHIAYLIVVCILKKILSLPEICLLINMQIENYEIEEAYNYFVTELENALTFTFSEQKEAMPNFAKKITLQTKAVRSTVLSCANKIYIEKLLKYSNEDKNKNV